jgi:hypothetical protein
MGTLYTSRPDWPGCTTPHLMNFFQVQIADDGDVWPSIWLDNLTTNETKTCGGRFRTPMIGGGASNKLFHALHKLAIVIEREEATWKTGQTDLPLSQPHPARPYHERHMDDGGGWFGLEVLADGMLRVALHPRETTGLNMPVEILIPPTTPYARSYAQLLKVYDAIGEDNAKLGNLIGHHTF